MINARARGLANLHGAATIALVAGFFWAYAALIRHVPFVHLGTEVNLWPYCLCAVAGLLAAGRGAGRAMQGYPATDPGVPVRVATRQVGAMAMLTFTMMAATQDHHISRLFLWSFMGWSWLGLCVVNARGPWMIARLAFGRGRRLPTVFVGRVGVFRELGDWVATKRALGFEPVGLLSQDPDPGPGASGGLPAPWRGGPGDLGRRLAGGGVAQVILLELPGGDAEAAEVIGACRAAGCRLLIRNDVGRRYPEPLVPVDEGGQGFYTLADEPLEDPLNRMLKRAFDVAVSLPVVLLVLPPLCAAVAAAQAVQAPGPLFHSRERRGLRGEPFRMVKFRSMVAGEADARAEARQAGEGDGRVFPLGRFIRRHSLDEVPQFWNVLRGDMSVVGPRPYMPLLDDEFRRQAPGHLARQHVKPGMTGLAQSLGFRGAVLNDEMLHRRLYWDVYYISHWSLGMDIQVTARTLLQVLRPPPTAY